MQENCAAVLRGRTRAKGAFFAGLGEAPQRDTPHCAARKANRAVRLTRFEPIVRQPRRYLTPSNSTSNISVALPGMTPPAPRAP